MKSNLKKELETYQYPKQRSYGHQNPCILQSIVFFCAVEFPKIILNELSVRTVEASETQKSINKRSDKRKDTLGARVKGRIANACSKEIRARYQESCCKSRNTDTPGRPNSGIFEHAIEIIV